jgi:ubiquitin-conjugating enzyme E2 M
MSRRRPPRRYCLRNTSLTDTCVQFLFLEPNASDPLNKEAAEDLRSNREGFKRNVRSAMGGGGVKNQTFDRVLKT